MNVNDDPLILRTCVASVGLSSVLRIPLADFLIGCFVVLPCLKTFSGLMAFSGFASAAFLSVQKRFERWMPQYAAGCNGLIAHFRYQRRLQPGDRCFGWIWPEPAGLVEFRDFFERAAFCLQRLECLHQFLLHLFIESRSYRTDILQFPVFVYT